MEGKCELRECGKRVDTNAALMILTEPPGDGVFFCCKSHGLRWLLRHSFLGGSRNSLVMELEPRIAASLED